MALTEANTVGHMLANSGMGKVYYKKGKFEKARVYLLAALGQSESLSNIEGIIISEFYLGKVNFDENNFNIALEHLDKAFAVANEYSRKHDIMSIHEMYASIYERLADIPAAYEHLKDFENLKEEIFQQNTMNKLRNCRLDMRLNLR